MALSYVGFIPMSLSYECFIPQGFILVGFISQGFYPMWVSSDLAGLYIYVELSFPSQ